MPATVNLAELCTRSWQVCDLERYLYSACIQLESPIFAQPDRAEHEDWLAHMTEGLLSGDAQKFERLCYQSPIRCVLLSQALKSFINDADAEELSDLLTAEQLQLLAGMFDFVKRRVLERSQQNITAMAQESAAPVIARAPLRLLLHLLPVEPLPLLSRLGTINLADEIFCARVIPQLSRFPNLTDLNLSRSDVQDEDLRGVANLEKLKKLDLSSTHIGNFGLEHLLACTSLQELRLDHSNIDDGAVFFLRQMNRNFRKVTLGRETVTTATVEQLKRLLLEVELVN